MVGIKRALVAVSLRVVDDMAAVGVYGKNGNENGIYDDVRRPNYVA